MCVGPVVQLARTPGWQSGDQGFKSPQVHHGMNAPTYTVYVLKSLKNGKRYVGMTSHTAQKRLSEHNNGENAFTRSNRPFTILYFEQNYCKACAAKREEFLKSGQGRRLLDSLESASAKG